MMTQPKLTLNRLAERLAAKADIEASQAREYITVCFSEIVALIGEGTNVKVKDFGTFTTDGTFEPDSALTSLVNSPFEPFEPLELDDEAMKLLAGEENTPESATERPVEPAEPDNEDEATPQPTLNIEPEMKMPIVPEPETIEEEAIEEEQTDAAEPVKKHNGIRTSDEPMSESRPRWSIPAACLFIGLVLGMAIMYMLIPYVSRHDASSDEAPAAAPDTTAVINTDTAITTTVADEETTTEMTDTVRAGYYFTTMAKKHYGDKAFWVYIYEENAARAGFKHPEHIAPGTVVVIPPPEKYGIDSQDKASVDTAKKKAYEIYAPYR